MEIKPGKRKGRITAALWLAKYNDFGYTRGSTRTDLWMWRRAP
jgi:hypothetical protein